VQRPVQNTWKWVTANVSDDEAALLAFAQGDHGGMGLWQPGGGAINSMHDVKVPYILALPGVLVDYIHTTKGGQCRPHELLLETNRLSAVSGVHPTCGRLEFGQKVVWGGGSGEARWR
jgi:hypothetical protein